MVDATMMIRTALGSRFHSFRFPPIGGTIIGTGIGIGVSDGHSAQLESSQTKQASKKTLVTVKHSQSKQRDDHSTIFVLSSLTLTLTLTLIV
jgi:hypothetical protein